MRACELIGAQRAEGLERARLQRGAVGAAAARADERGEAAGGEDGGALPLPPGVQPLAQLRACVHVEHHA
jgi:hypothetical protein